MDNNNNNKMDNNNNKMDNNNNKMDNNKNNNMDNNNNNVYNNNNNFYNVVVQVWYFYRKKTHLPQWKKPQQNVPKNDLKKRGWEDFWRKYYTPAAPTSITSLIMSILRLGVKSLRRDSVRVSFTVLATLWNVPVTLPR